MQSHNLVRRDRLEQVAQVVSVRHRAARRARRLLDAVQAAPDPGQSLSTIAAQGVDAVRLRS
jgi:hypothetical protein